MSRVRLLGWVHAAFGGLGLTAGLLICLGLAADPSAREAALPWALGLFAMVAVGWLLPSLVGGIGLASGAPWGRWVIVAVSAMLLLMFPLGTLLGGLSLWALFAQPTAATPAASPPAAPTPIAAAPRVSSRALPGPKLFPGPRPGALPGLLVAALFVACLFVAGIGAGYRLNHQPPPPPFDGGFYPALAVLAAIVVGVAVKRPFAWGRAPGRTVWPWERPMMRRRAEQDRKDRMAARARRIAALKADPDRHKYGVLVEAGEAWSDEQIAYDRDPDWRVACPHLRTVEGAMRQAGVAVKLADWPEINGVQLNAFCRIVAPGLKARFRLPDFVSYVEMYMGGRSVEDYPSAFVTCGLCNSTIHTRHPDEGPPDTPWFPSAPESSP
jgi:hypothetical protein